MAAYSRRRRAYISEASASLALSRHTVAASGSSENATNANKSMPILFGRVPGKFSGVSARCLHNVHTWTLGMRARGALKLMISSPWAPLGRTAVSDAEIGVCLQPLQFHGAAGLQGVSQRRGAKRSAQRS